MIYIWNQRSSKICLNIDSMYEIVWNVWSRSKRVEERSSLNRGLSGYVEGLACNETSVFLIYSWIKNSHPQVSIMSFQYWMRTEKYLSVFLYPCLHSDLSFGFVQIWWKAFEAEGVTCSRLLIGMAQVSLVCLNYILMIPIDYCHY